MEELQGTIFKRLGTKTHYQQQNERIGEPAKISAKCNRFAS